jgi:hypothetical protein
MSVEYASTWLDMFWRLFLHAWVWVLNASLTDHCDYMGMYRRCPDSSTEGSCYCKRIVEWVRVYLGGT